MNKVAQASEKVAGVFYDWLKGEVATSSRDRNVYLDDFQKGQEGLRLGYDNDSNWTARKNEMHMMQLGVWGEAFAEEPLNEELSAKILFRGLMATSGAFRNQCYLQSTTSEEYIERRKKAVDIDIEAAVSTRFNTHLPLSGNFANARISTEVLDSRRLEAMDIGQTAVRTICDLGKSGYGIGLKRSRSVVEMQTAQYNWITFAADCVALAAKLRKGDLEAVPFLPPINISDNPGIVYPLEASFPGFLESL